MGQFKEYKNLYNVYRHIVRKIRAAFLIFFPLFIASFIFSIHHTSDTTIGIAVITFIFCFFSGILCLVIPLVVEMTFGEFDPMALNRINEALPKIKMQEGFGVTQDAIVVVGFVRLGLIPIKDVLWIYKDTVVSSYGIIPIVKTSHLMICGKDRKNRKKEYLVWIKNKSEIVDFLKEELNKYRNGIFYGYSAELYSLYHNNIQKMIAMSTEYDNQYNENIFAN